ASRNFRHGGLSGVRNEPIARPWNRSRGNQRLGLLTTIRPPGFTTRVISRATASRSSQQVGEGVDLSPTTPTCGKTQPQNATSNDPSGKGRRMALAIASE